MSDKTHTQNACKLCSPLGAAMVFKGIRNCLPFLHGSQGCATYIRRYMISHFREPVDIASSSFSEEDAIFGGARNFADGVANVIAQYNPEIIGVATTCLSETIGENMLAMIRDYKNRYDGKGPPLIHVSTPAYTGTHTDGFHAAVRAVLEALASGSSDSASRQVNVLPGMVSCADLRFLRTEFGNYGLNPLILPDYSDTLDGESWDDYNRMSPGGTGMDQIRLSGNSSATIQFGHTLIEQKNSGGKLLQGRHGVPLLAMGLPIGMRLSDQWYTALSQLSGHVMPAALRAERGRLIDAYVDGHKYVAGKKAIVFGDPDWVISMAAFLSEIGIRPVICATGSKPARWDELLNAEIEDGTHDITALKGADQARIREYALAANADLIVGSSKGFPLAKELGLPLLRTGFPVHDRFGAQRQLSLGYRGTQVLFDAVVNTLMEAKQNASAIGKLSEGMSDEIQELIHSCARLPLNPAQPRPYVAVATREGMLVNQHLGEARRFTIFGVDPEDETEYLEIEDREALSEGGREGRWQNLAEILSDCRAILVSAAGSTPKAVLTKLGLRVIEMEGMIENGLDHIFVETPLPAAVQRKFTSCGAGVTCGGDGTGCG